MGSHQVSEGRHVVHAERDPDKQSHLPDDALAVFVRHLDALVDVGLVENRKRKDPSSDGLSSYYRATALGEGILEYGIRELMREEWELRDAYGE